MFFDPEQQFWPLKFDVHHCLLLIILEAKMNLVCIFVQVSMKPTGEEDQTIQLLINPRPKMSFALTDYKKKKLQELSKR